MRCARMYMDQNAASKRVLAHEHSGTSLIEESPKRRMFDQSFEQRNEPECSSTHAHRTDETPYYFSFPAFAEGRELVSGPNEKIVTSSIPYS